MRELQRVEEAERLLIERDYESVRVRSHGNVARIEVAPTQRERLIQQADEVAQALQGLGFRHVCLDLLGYRQGSMDDPSA
jgi:uncharacterized protein